MKIQVLSDIHLEFRDEIVQIKPKAEYLFLCGDIGKLHETSYRNFIDYVSHNWKKVFITLGNHEFYHSNKDIYQLMREYTEFFEKYENVILLEKSVIYINDEESKTQEKIPIIGCVLWSHVDKTTDAGSRINCLSQIKQKTKTDYGEIRTSPLGADNYNELNINSRKWLIETYENLREQYNKIIIMTHYPIIQDTETSAPQFRNEPIHIKNLFSNNLNIIPASVDQQIISIAGHTHYSFDFVNEKYPNIRYISNQLGYPGEKSQYYPYSENKNEEELLEKVFEIF
jgi:predicted phosphohydrolase